MRVSISYFDQALEKTDSQSRQLFNFAILEFFGGTKFRENGENLWKLQNLIPAKFDTLKVSAVHQNPGVIRIWP